VRLDVVDIHCQTSEPGAVEPDECASMKTLTRVPPSLCAHKFRCLSLTAVNRHWDERRQSGVGGRRHSLGELARKPNDLPQRQLPGSILFNAQEV
jgi:hypothetical protein